MAGKKKTDKVDQKIQSIVKRARSWRYFNIFLIIFIIAIFVYWGRGLFIAAVVGGKPISRLAVIKELESQSGQETLDNLISKELVLQEANRQGVRISDEAIEQEIAAIDASLQAQGTTLDAELTLRGQTTSQLRQNIRIQKIVEELLKDDVNVTDAEIQTYYEENQAFFGEEREFADLEADIREQLKQEKISQQFSQLLQQLRSESNIYYLVDY